MAFSEFYRKLHSATLWLPEYREKLDLDFRHTGILNNPQKISVGCLKSLYDENPNWTFRLESTPTRIAFTAAPGHSAFLKTPLYSAFRGAPFLERNRFRCIG